MMTDEEKLEAILKMVKDHPISAIHHLYDLYVAVREKRPYFSVKIVEHGNRVQLIPAVQEYYAQRRVVKEGYICAPNDCYRCFGRGMGEYKHVINGVCFNCGASPQTIQRIPDL